MNRLSSLLGFLAALPLIPVLLWWQKHERKTLFDDASHYRYMATEYPNEFERGEPEKYDCWMWIS